MSDLNDRLIALHGQMNRALTNLPPEALNWVPGPDMNSLAVVVTHTAGAERFWIADIAGQETSNRVRANEFQATASQAYELIDLLNSALAYSQGVLARLTRDDLDGMRLTPDGRTLSAAWALLHALEHTAVHTGHIELTCQMWDQQSLADPD